MELIREIENIGDIKRDEIKRAISNGNSAVNKFYDGAVIFVSGASGFLGKHLVQKLLSSTNTKKIYILLRPRKGKNVEKRFKTILDDPVYDFIRKEQPDFKEKIIPIEGDVSELNLGIAEKDWSTLINEVNVIFHSAATINFEETLIKATLTNVRGTREMIKLAKNCKLLKSIVHVSTAYAHATKSRIEGEVEEDFYASPFSPEELIELSENSKEDELDNIIKSYTLDWPNSYTFTKAVTEELIRTTARDLPLCIVRPAIVISAYRDPSPGWVDAKNAYGPSGLILGIFLGIIHTLLIRNDINIDFVPVDIVNNTSIVAAKETFTRFRNRPFNKRITIYTVTGTRNPLYVGNFTQVLNTVGRKLISTKALWYCYNISTPYKSVFIFLTWLLHYIPAAIIDGLCILVGKKPMLLKMYKVSSSLSKIFIYFINNYWIFHDTNTLNLYNNMSVVDKQIYSFDMAAVDVDLLSVIWVFGVRKYIIRDDLEQTNYALKKQAWLKVAHFIILPTYLISLLTILYCVFILIFKILM